MLELLCSEHYFERIGNGTNKETKKLPMALQKAILKNRKKEGKIKCHKEKEHTEVKLEDRQRK